MRHISRDLVSDPGDMLNILEVSKAQGTAVGIKAPNLGVGIFVTAVADILRDRDITVVFHNYDITGYMLERNKLKLAEINSVIAFRSAFKNPFLKTIRHTN